MLKELVSQSSADRVPKEWKTTKQWASEENLNCSMTSRYLRDGVALGIIERKMFRIPISGIVRPVPHYRLKAK